MLNAGVNDKGKFLYRFWSRKSEKGMLPCEARTMCMKGLVEAFLFFA